MTLDELVEGFRAVATASVADSVDKLCGRRGYMDHELRPRINEKRIVGPAVTVHEGPTDEFLPPQHALDVIDAAPAGSVVVIGIEGDANVAVWGGLMTAGSFARGLAGAVLDAGVRDIYEIRRDYDFPVISRSVSPGTTLGRYRTLGANRPIRCGGIEVNPGDIVVGDLDGVAVVPRDRAEEVLRMAQEIDRRELEQAKLIVAARSLKEGLAKYGRI
jgi:regulator of RNase E activity RraA